MAEPSVASRCPGCGSADCTWPRLECDRPVTGTPKAPAAPEPEIPDNQICPDCFGDMNAPDHYGCSFCGGCECQGEC